MAETTGIQWCDATWNPWIGCHKVSPGCKLCYAERDSKRYGNTFTNIVRSKTLFYAPVQWLGNGKVAPGSRIFTCSISDFFVEEADQWRNEAWAIIKSTPKFIYIILTKRASRIQQCLPPDWGPGYPNVWLLVSTEDQYWYETRWGILAPIPAIVKGVSMEPMLGGIDPSGVNPDWIITGGESGRGARKANPGWFRYIRRHCLMNKIPFFHKQNGGTMKIDGAWGGRELDGAIWDQFPGYYGIQE